MAADGDGPPSPSGRFADSNVAVGITGTGVISVPLPKELTRTTRAGATSSDSEGDSTPENVRKSPSEGQHEYDNEEDAIEDPWSLIRVAMGSLAGASWRLKQALVWPEKSFELRDDPQKRGWWELFRRTQTFDDYRASMPFRPNSARGIIDLVSVDELSKVRDKVHLESLVAHLEVFIGFKVVLRPQSISLESWAHPREQPSHENRQRLGTQYGAHFILGRLRRSTDPRSICTLGVTSVDLYPPRTYEFVTGIADQAQRVGLYSFSRYYNTSKEEGSFDLKTKRTICLVMMLCRESLKLCGFGECHMLRCLMNPFPGGSPEAIRGLPFSLCCICLRKLEWLTQMDLLDRYANLPAVIGEWFDEETVWLNDRMKQVGLPTCASQRDVNRAWSTV